MQQRHPLLERGTRGIGVVDRLGEPEHDVGVAGGVGGLLHGGHPGQRLELREQVAGDRRGQIIPAAGQARRQAGEAGEDEGERGTHTEHCAMAVPRGPLAAAGTSSTG